MARTYEDLIETFAKMELPTIQVKESTQFEAAVAYIIGTKQRRQGPLPTPEVQVKIREYVRERRTLHFYLPWGGSKQQEGGNVDILELMAVKQLHCLKTELAALGYQSRFHFRVEDLGHLYLHGEHRLEQVERYTQNFRLLVETTLGEQIFLESFKTNLDHWQAKCEEYQPVFENYLRGYTGIDSLKTISWNGEIPVEQREHYYHMYGQLYPNRDPILELSHYFASALTRVHLDALGYPSEPVIKINFAKPVPGMPEGAPGVFYRTLPERMTRLHQAPWRAQGHLIMGDEEVNCVKFNGDEPLEHYYPGALELKGIMGTPYRICTPYVLA